MPLRSLLIALFLILVCVVIISNRANADPIWVTQYGGDDGYCNQITASGETYDCDGFTAASPNLPFDTLVSVSYAGNSVVVRINDRCGQCSLDISMASADVLGLPGADFADVTFL